MSSTRALAIANAPPPVVTELISFQCTTFPRRRQSFASHLHHFFQLDVLLAGRLTVRVEGDRPFAARAGDGWLIPPLVRHGFEQHTGFRQASFKVRLAPVYWPAAGLRWRHVRFPCPLREMLDVAGRGQPSPARAVALGTLCVLEVLGREQGAAVEPELDPFRQRLWPLLEHIENEPQAGWSVARMATTCHLSVDHFSRCFHRLLGQTPSRYLLEARLRSAAAALLADSSRPIKDVAEASGYATVHAFSAAFKHALGRSPAAYRRAPSEW